MKTISSNAHTAAAGARRYFRDDEFTCRCGCGGNRMRRGFVAKLERVREAYYRKPLVVTSGYRCAAHEKTVGGTGENHPNGVAADLLLAKGGDMKEFLAAFHAVGLRRAVLYRDKPHIHVDDNENLPEGVWIK